MVLFAGCIAGAEARNQPDDYSWIRGANYVPSYARNDVQIWMDYDPDVIDREFALARRLKLNSVRVFLQYAVYKRNRQEFLAHYENFLSLCKKHDIKAMIVVFDSCFGDYPDLANYRDKDWMANPGQNMLGPEYWPELEKYVDDVVGAYRNDDRIVMWDVMNEPMCTSHAATEEGREKIWKFLDHFLDVVKQKDPTHPLTVGYMASGYLPRLIDKIDVLGWHNYTGDMDALRADVKLVKELGIRHSKPVIINEIARRDTGQDYWKFMPLLAEEKIGWYFWELMLDRTQFSRGDNPIQGVIYPDGTCRNAREIAAILHPAGTERNVKQVAAEAALPQRPRWTKDEAWDWYSAHEWLVGFNYVPSTACNTTEWWQKGTFDPETFDRELGWAKETGFNTARCFIQYIVWKDDAEGFKKRFDRFLAIADRHGISIMPVLFDDCSFGWPPQMDPYLGKQREVTPGMILPSWTPSPGVKLGFDAAERPMLKRYVQDMIATFKDDKRVVIWDLFNEPMNRAKVGTDEFIETIFKWARDANPTQPLTVGAWIPPGEAALRHCDIVSYHLYGGYDTMRSVIGVYKRYGRPVICTEWMARPLVSNIERELELFKKQGVGCYMWGLVNGRTQCQYPWFNKPNDPVHEVGWFHDLFHGDGKPYRLDEILAIRRITADKKLNFEAIRNSSVKEAKEEAKSYKGNWTLWRGAGPRDGYLFYSNTAGDQAEKTFQAREVVLVHKTGPDCGIAEIIINGKLAREIDTYTTIHDSDWNHKTVLIKDHDLQNSVNIKIKVTGRKNQKSTNTYVQIVGFDLN